MVRETLKQSQRREANRLRMEVVRATETHEQREFRKTNDRINKKMQGLN